MVQNNLVVAPRPDNFVQDIQAVSGNLQEQVLEDVEGLPEQVAVPIQ